jgi:transcriptional regulator with PAS, ATPase and Fis domain
VITATNTPLADLVTQGTFRADLYYRLNVLKVVLPPLADRREDIPLLADHFVRKFSLQQGKQIEGISADALRVLLEYDFPGNVRELQNVIEHAVVLCRSGQIESNCLPAELTGGKSEPAHNGPPSSGGPLLQAEAAAIVETLRQHAGHRGQTAAALGIDKTTLWRKMRKHGITQWSV